MTLGLWLSPPSAMLPETTQRIRKSVLLLVGLCVGFCIILLVSQKRIGSNLPDENNDPTNVNVRRKLVGKEEDGPLKILYTITSLAEYNTGSRATVKGSDRLQETMIPIISEGVHSMVAMGYQVDVFVVAHYILKPERLQLIRDSLPDGVGLKYWDDAMPLGYNTEKYQESDGTSLIGERFLSLARQHRFVIRDHFLLYDVFVSFEDDMLVTGHHVQHYVKLSEELLRLQKEAPDDLPGNPDDKFYSSSFSGPMTKGQLSRMMPGFIRVEVLLDPTSKKFHTKPTQVPIDLVFDEKTTTTNKNITKIDPRPCCHVAKERSSPKRPENPSSDQVMLWETESNAFGSTKNASDVLDWVALLRGPTYDKETKLNTMVGDYWAGVDGYFDKKRRPGGNARNLINNMVDGWRHDNKLWQWHTEICPGGFLPPYEAPHYRFDGLDLRDVEWWSGGLHLVTKRHACNLQRIMSLNPDEFHFHLLYHTANNKQSSIKTDRFTRANDLLGQLNTVRKNAQKALEKQKQR